MREGIFFCIGLVGDSDYILRCAARAQANVSESGAPIPMETSVDGNIRAFFRRLEVYHGTPLVATTFALLSASLNGLSAYELEDLLSADDEVLYSVLVHHVPPARRLPTLVLTSLLADCGDYLVERGADGVKLIALYHRAFREVAADLYLPDPAAKTKAAQSLADYFSGRWVNELKEELALKKSPMTVTSCGQPEQPCRYGSVIDGPVNLRKLSELPNALVQLSVLSPAYKHQLQEFLTDPYTVSAYVSGFPGGVGTYQLLNLWQQNLTPDGGSDGSFSQLRGSASLCVTKALDEAGSSLAQKAPERAAVLTRLGDFLQVLGGRKDALALYTRVISGGASVDEWLDTLAGADQQQNLDACLKIGRLLIDVGDPGKALRVLEAGLSTCQKVQL